MKKFNIEIKVTYEEIPDNGIWDGDAFQDPIEADSAEEALDLAIDRYIEESINNGYDVSDWKRDKSSIEYTDEDGMEVSVIFKAEEIKE